MRHANRHSQGSVRRQPNDFHKIRYAVVGLGHIAQNAILPAFQHAQTNSVLTALVSDDASKLRVLSRQYGVKNCFNYEEYDSCLASGGIDAVYIALPNNMHEEYCVRAARRGVHVLCEKPLAPTSAACRNIISVCGQHGVKLMTAYRLHFERGNLEAVEVVHTGKVGEPRIFNSVFTQQVKLGNIRTQARYGSSALSDIGVYCINAARYLFRAEPTEGFCFAASRDDARFREVDEMMAVILRFPGERLASFTASFGAADTADYQIIGTKGKLRAVQAYDYSMPMTLELTCDGRTERKTYGLRDQFAPELLHFSDCILTDREPEPSGYEGLRDVSIIELLLKSAGKGIRVKFEAAQREHYPDLKQEIHRPRIRKPRLVHAVAPTS